MSMYVGLAAHSRAPSCDFLGLRGCDFQSRAESVGFSRQSFQCPRARFNPTAFQAVSFQPPIR